jgi:hypothetical protein
MTLNETNRKINVYYDNKVMIMITGYYKLLKIESIGAVRNYKNIYLTYL